MECNTNQSLDDCRLNELTDKIREELQESLRPRDGIRAIKIAPTKEASRVNFYIWRLINLPAKLALIDAKVCELHAIIEKDSSWRYLSTVSYFLLNPFRLVFVTTKHLLKSMFFMQIRYRFQLEGLF